MKKKIIIISVILCIGLVLVLLIRISGDRRSSRESLTSETDMAPMNTEIENAESSANELPIMEDNPIEADSETSGLADESRTEQTDPDEALSVSDDNETVIQQETESEEDELPIIP